MSILEKNSGLNEFMTKQRHLVFNVSILGNATPASKSHFVDISDSVFISSEGKDDVTAQDPLTNLTVQTANDAAGRFTVLLESQIAKSIKSCKVYSGTTLLTSSAQISELKNLVIDVDSTDILSTASTFTYRIELDFQAE